MSVLSRTVRHMPRPTRHASSRRPDGIGHLYLIQFDNHVIKAGRTANLANRNHQHTQDAGRYNLRITRQWSSESIDNIRAMEQRLHAVLGKVGRRTRSGREYYRNIPFSVARYQAENLHRVPRRECCCGHCVDPVDVVVAAQITSDPQPSNSALEADLRLTCGSTIRACFTDEDLGPGGQYPLRIGDRLTVEIAPRSRDGVWTVYLNEFPTRLG